MEVSMKRMFIFVLSVFAIAPNAYAQSDAELIEQALAAAPRRASDNASVVKWSADHTYNTIKEGTNQVVCYSRADQRDRPPFAVQCTSLANLDRVSQNRKFRAESSDAEGERGLVASAAADGSRVEVEFGSWFRSMNGENRESAGVHTTIAMPGSTMASTGFPESRDQGGAYIMAAGTTEAHLMVP